MGRKRILSYCSNPIKAGLEETEREAWWKMMTCSSLGSEAKSGKVGEDMLKSRWFCNRLDFCVELR